MLDVAEAFMAMDISYAYFGSQHQFWAALLLHCLNCLSKVAVALQGTIKRSLCCYYLHWQ